VGLPCICTCICVALKFQIPSYSQDGALPDILYAVYDAYNNPVPAYNLVMTSRACVSVSVCVCATFMPVHGVLEEHITAVVARVKRATVTATAAAAAAAIITNNSNNIHSN
jgi:hypothetical protein